MNSPNYVGEKMREAIECLCGDGSFAKRLENATVSALFILDQKDLTGELADDLKFILKWTKANIVGGKLQMEPGEMERKKLIEKMLHVMLETHQK